MTTKLLAVDDSKTMRKVLEITFAGNTYDSKIVGSAEEALASLKESPPQLVVVDGYLGGTSGYDLCRDIKAAAPQVKVVLLSSKQRPYDPAQGSSVGVDIHFDKPFDSTKFLDKLGQLDLAAAGASAAPKEPAPAPSVAAVPPSTFASSASPKPEPVAARPAPAAPVAPAPVASRPAAPPLSPAAQPAIAQSVTAEPKSKPSIQAPVAAAASKVNGSMSEKLGEMGLSPDQVQGVLALSREVVEQVVWEVVPQLAEVLIKEEIARLTAE